MPQNILNLQIFFAILTKLRPVFTDRIFIFKETFIIKISQTYIVYSFSITKNMCYRISWIILILWIGFHGSIYVYYTLFSYVYAHLRLAFNFIYKSLFKLFEQRLEPFSYVSNNYKIFFIKHNWILYVFIWI